MQQTAQISQGDEGSRHQPAEDEVVERGLIALGGLDGARAVADAFRAREPMDPHEVQRRLEVLVAGMLSAGLKAEMEVRHSRAGDLYARELHIPRGTFCIGEIQREQHISVISQGDISMLGPTGGIVRIRGPVTMASQPGVRKCGFAHEDTVWTSVHWMGDHPGWHKLSIKEVEDILVSRSIAGHLEYMAARPAITGSGE